MSTFLRRPLMLALRLALEDAGGWRTVPFTVLGFLAGTSIAAIGCRYATQEIDSLEGDVALAVIVGLSAFGVRVGARLKAIYRRPALAALPNLGANALLSVALFGLGLGGLAAVAGALAAPRVLSLGSLSAFLTFICIFAAGFVGSRGFRRRRSLAVERAFHPASLAHREPASQAGAHVASESLAVHLDGPARLRAASRYAIASDPRWSRGRALLVLIVVGLWGIIASMVVTLWTAESGSLVERFQGLVYAPSGGAESAGRIRGAGRNLLLPLAFVPLLALTQHRGRGQLPFSRATIAEQSVQRFCSFGLTIYGVIALLGLGFVGAATRLADDPFSERLMPYGVSVLLMLSVLPVLAAVALWGASLEKFRRATGPGSLSAVALGALSCILALGFAATQLSVHLAFEVREGRVGLLPLLVTAALVFLVSSSALPRLFQRYYRTVPLTP